MQNKTIEPKIIREINWKEGFHIYQDGEKKLLKDYNNKELYHLAYYYENESDVTILKKLLKQKGGYKLEKISHNGVKKDEIEITSPKEVMRTDIPKEEWAKIIRQESIKEIINIVDKRNEHNKKLAYYKRETLIKELKELLDNDTQL